MRNLWLSLILLFVGVCSADGQPPTSQGPMAIYQAEASFEDVIENIKMAIEERGMLVSGTLHVSDMLNRTGPDLGYSQVFEQAESVEFCSASISHQMTQAAAENMAICPFTISVFIKTSEPEKVYVAYRKPTLAGEATDVTNAIVELLDGIITDSIE